MASMGAILIMSVLVFLGAVAARESSSVDMGHAVKYWEKKFPGVVVPTPLREAVSPVEGSVLAGRFAMHIQRGCLTPSASSSFCKMGGLICDDETLHSRRQHQLNKGVDTYKVDKGSKGSDDSNPLPPRHYKGSKGSDDSNPLPPRHYKGSKGSDDSNPLPPWHYKGSKGSINKRNKSPTMKGFFMESDLAIGATVRLFDRPLIPSKPFVPKVVADALPPIVPENLHKLQQIFNIEEGTEMYDVVAGATRECALNDAMEDEKFICALSLESFANFMASNIGPDVTLLTNSPRSRSVKGPMRVANFTTYDSVEDKINVAICHIRNFPSLMHMCHVTPDVKIFEAILTSDNGVKIRATGMCHLDTKMWLPSYVAFRILGTKPGTPVCHWTYEQDLLLYATKTEESSVIQEAVAHGGHMAMDPIPARDVMGM